ncbi:MAG: phosphoribosylformylglycinamidine synthase subunit PurS [Thermoplasmata archaeon]|nr:phosphoribosylformylglycinamidine synthase subunit PurS [Thermoplasmata archaeon]
MYLAEVKIGLKKGVADPEGANTHKALELLGFTTVQSVKTSKFFTIELNVESEEEARQMVEEMSTKLLANPVIHNYEITIRGI